jgi:hypothetical protein
MTNDKSQRFTVINNRELLVKEQAKQQTKEESAYKDLSKMATQTDFQTNPIYEKLLNFRNLQDAQKKRFSVDDLFKLC